MTMEDLETLLTMSSEDEDECSQKKKTKRVEDDKMTLAQMFQCARRRSSSSQIPEHLTSAITVFSSPEETSSSFERKEETPNSYLAKLSAIERANNVQANLDPGFPSFVKSMLRSHVTQGFWMGLSIEFCSTHLPKQDIFITLVDENQEEYFTQFLARKCALSGGWRWFAISHGLVEGDAIVFQLVKPTAFQVYIIRAHIPGAMDGVVGFLTLDSSLKHKSIGKRLKNTGKIVRKRRTMSSSCKRKQETSNYYGAKLSAIERANSIQANLDPGSPSFVKSMLRSHVTQGFQMGLPLEFCNAHLPEQDVSVTLVDENQEEYFTNFLSQINALCGGWKWFAVDHGLLEGDALVFQLVKATTFQVYIIRGQSSGAVNGALSFLALDSSQKPNSIGKRIKHTEQVERKHRRTTRRKKSEADIKRRGFMETSVVFKDMKDPEGFKVIVNGLVINSEFTDIERARYYELCCSQDAFLHDNLLQGMTTKLAAGIISQTVHIADVIKRSKLNSSVEDFTAWHKCIGALKQLGMNVGFLRARVQKLFSIAYGSEEVVDSNYHNMVTRKARFSELKRYSTVLDQEMEIVKTKIGEYEFMFQAEVSSPW